MLSEDSDLPSRTYDDLPWYLRDLRPAGFLGGQIPARYPELGAPEDIRRWSAEHCLEYLVRHGHDTVGAWLVGEPAAYLRARVRGPTIVSEAARVHPGERRGRGAHSRPAHRRASGARGARSLTELGMITEGVHERVQWLELFGDLIANTDMHGGNLSFYARGTGIIDLAPVYDMTSMLYAPDRNQLIERSFEPRPPRSDQILVWEAASTAALELWDRARSDHRISAGFRELAGRNHDRVAKWCELAERV